MMFQKKLTTSRDDGTFKRPKRKVDDGSAKRERRRLKRLMKKQKAARWVDISYSRARMFSFARRSDGRNGNVFREEDKCSVNADKGRT